MHSMSSTITYDPYEHLLPTLPYVESQFQSEDGSPNGFDLSSTDSRSGTDPSQNSSNSSPRQSTSYSSEPSIDNVGVNFNENEIIDFSSMTQLIEKLRIIEEPRAFYRERYCSETDPSKHRAQRFIRAHDDTSQYEYPTIQIPSKWHDPHGELYIRVTLVTILSEKVPDVCIHPYAIDTQENEVLRDPNNNSLYFPITREEILNGQKSFRISRKKMIQHDLKSYGPLRLFDLNQHDVQRVVNLQDAKQIIETYQLWKSQLVFTIAEQWDSNTLPVPIPFTSVTSQIMCDEASRRRKESLINDTLYTTICEDNTIKCTPRKGDWAGGDDVLMTIPKLNKRKAFNIYFDYGTLGRVGDIKVSFVDSKTIFFQTPPCAMLVTGKDLTIPIIVMQNDVILARIEFAYLARKLFESIYTPDDYFYTILAIKTTLNLCSGYQFDMMNDNYISNKRRHLMSDCTQIDGGESLVQQMNRLTTEEKPAETNHRPANHDKNARFDKYLGQLQEAVVDFIRTNNPSQLFRRTRLLIAKCDENPPPLDDAIRRGHINLALRLIEQAIEMSAPNGLLERENNDGQTPLLLAAKCNQWILIEAILKKRLDLIEKTDKHDDNILHLLANASEDKTNDMIKNVLVLIPNDLITKFLKMKNKNNQTPIEIAQTKDNSHCVDLFEKY